MNFSQFLETNRTYFVQQMQQHLDNCAIPSQKEVSFAHETISNLQVYSTKGKLIRGLIIPYLVQVLWKTDEATSLDQAWYAASAIELAHSALLIHDDIIDNDDQRRGQPSMHRHLAGHYGSSYGVSLAICTGDIAIFLAFELLQRCTSNPSILNRLTTYFSQELRTVGIGEMIDVQMSAAVTIPTVEAIEEMYRLKTARYTFSLPFTMGVLLAQTNITTQIPMENLIPLLERAGEHLGILFQIQDDQIGLIGSQEQTGKPVGSDIREGKKTIAWSALYTRASSAEQQMLDRIASNAEAGNTEMQQIISLYNKYDIPSVIQERKMFHTNQVMDIEKQLLPMLSQPVLSDLITMLEHRTK